MKKQLLVPLVVIMLSGNIFAQSKSKSNISSHFANSIADKIVFEAGNEALKLTSGSFSSLSNCKPYLAWRNMGDEKWVQDFAGKIEKSKISENETRLTFQLGAVSANITVKQLEGNVLEFSGNITNQSRKTIELARFHYLHGNAENGNTSFIGNDIYSFKLIRKTDSLVAPRIRFEKFWKGMGPDYPMLSNPIHDDANWAVSPDFGVFAPALNQPGWFIGFTGPGTAYGEVGFKTLESPSPFFAGVLLDNIILEPDSSRILEKCIVYTGDWQDGMAYWIKKTAKELKPLPVSAPLTGYC